VAFRDINPKKLTFLLSQGTHEGELRKFFNESKTQLLLNGAKVQNLPHGREERIRAICERLSRKTDDVLQRWFQKNVSISAPDSLDEVLMYLEAFFDENEPLPAPQAKIICRSALVYLFGAEPDVRLVRMLQGPIGTPTAEPPVIAALPIDRANEPNDAAEIHQVAPISAPQNYQLGELLASIIADDDGAIDTALSPFPESTRTLVDALLLIREGDVDAAKAHLETLNSIEPESELIKSALARTRHVRSQNITSTGVRAAIPQPLNGDPDTDSYEVIGIYTNESDTGAIFVKPLFLVSRGHLYQLSNDDQIRLFPESGSVMTFKSSLRRPLKPRELVHWRVSERDGAEGRTRFHLDSELSPLIELVKISVPSTDADEVRGRIKTYGSSTRLQPGQQVMFLLADSMIVVSPKGADLTRDEAFDDPWQAWGSLDTWLIEGRQYCLDTSQSEASSFDMSPLDAAFKKLLKSLDATHKLSVSKEQRRKIAELLRGQSGGEVAQRARRIAESIDQISINEDELNAVLTLLGSHSDVHRRVDELVAKEFEERQAERVGLQGEISALKQKKADLEKAGREIERINQNRIASTTSSVRDAFGKAIREGAATLANAEIFQLLAEKPSRTSHEAPTATPSDQLDGRVVYGELSTVDAKARLAVLGINARQAFVLSELAKIANQSGAMLIFRGSLARQCVQTLIRQNRETAVTIDVPFGLTSPDFLRRRLEGIDEAKGLALLNADLSAIEIYGADLLDMLMERAMSNATSSLPILMSCIGGDLSLPFPNAIRRVSISVDLDSNWDEGQRLLDEVDPDELVLFPILQRRVRDALAAMDEGDRAHVERAFVKAAGLQ
jgi:hypothetical protein